MTAKPVLVVNIKKNVLGDGACRFWDMKQISLLISQPQQTCDIMSDAIDFTDEVGWTVLFIRLLQLISSKHDS